MKIGVLVTANQNSGGTYQYIQTLLEYGLQPHPEHEYVVYVHRDSDMARDPLLGRLSPSFHVKELVRSSSAIKRRCLYILRLAALYFRFLRPWVVSEYNQLNEDHIDLLIIPYASHIGEISGCPYVMAVHDLAHKEIPKQFSVAERISRFILLSRTVPNAYGVICDSDVTKQGLVKWYGAKPEKVFLVPLFPGDHVRASQPSSAEVKSTKAKYNLPDDFLFYPSQFWKHKNHARLILAIHEIKVKFQKQIHVVLCGSKKEAFEDVMELIERFRLSEQVHYLGYVPNQDLPGIYKNATALIYPSLFDPMGIPILEAFALGVPVLASNTGAIVEHSKGAILSFSPESVAEITDAIVKIMTNAVLRKKLIDHGTLLLAKDLTPEKYSSAVAQILANFEFHTPKSST